MLGLIFLGVLVWVVCGFITFRLIEAHETEIVLHLRLHYQRAYESEDWSYLKQMAMAGGPFTLALVLSYLYLDKV